MTLSLGKDLLGLEPLSGEQIKLILDTAEPFKEISERAIKKVPTLRGVQWRRWHGAARSVAARWAR